MLAPSIPASATVAAGPLRTAGQSRSLDIATTLHLSVNDPMAPSPRLRWSCNATAGDRPTPLREPRSSASDTRRALNPHSLARHPAVQFNQASM